MQYCDCTKKCSIVFPQLGIVKAHWSAVMSQCSFVISKWSLLITCSNHWDHTISWCHSSSMWQFHFVMSQWGIVMENQNITISQCGIIKAQLNMVVLQMRAVMANSALWCRCSLNDVALTRCDVTINLCNFIMKHCDVTTENYNIII